MAVCTSRGCYTGAVIVPVTATAVSPFFERGTTWISKAVEKGSRREGESALDWTT